MCLRGYRAHGIRVNCRVTVHGDCPDFCGGYNLRWQILLVRRTIWDGPFGREGGRSMFSVNVHCPSQRFPAKKWTRPPGGLLDLIRMRNMSDDLRNSGFSDADNDELLTYRAVSKLALLALVLSLLSVLALTHAVFLVLPLLAIGVATLALRQISSSEQAITGRSFAIIAIALAGFAFTSALSRGISRDWIMTSRAEDYSSRWLQLIADGKIYEAHQLTLPEKTRRKPDIGLPDFYEAGGKHLHEFEEFFGEPPADQVCRHGEGADFQFRRIVKAGPEGNNDIVVLEYSMQSGQKQPLNFHIVVRRLVREDAERGSWRVLRIVAPQSD